MINSNISHILSTAILLLLIISLTSCGPSNGALKKAMDDPQKFASMLDEVKNINKPDRNGMTLLSYAVWTGRPEVVEILMKKGADPLMSGQGSRDSLSYVGTAGENSVEIMKIIFKHRPDLLKFDESLERVIRNCIWHFKDDHIEFLLDSGLPLDFRFATTRSLLAEAMSHKQDNVDAILLLLEKGADPNSKDKNGMTPLFWATRGMKRYEDFYKALARADCNFNHLDDDGHSAGYYFALNGQIIPVLWMLQLGHVPNEEYYVQEFVERTITTESTEWVYNVGKPVLPSQQLTRQKVAKTTTVNDEYVYPLMEFVKRKYPDYVDKFLDAGYPTFDNASN